MEAKQALQGEDSAAGRGSYRFGVPLGQQSGKPVSSMLQLLLGPWCDPESRWKMHSPQECGLQTPQVQAAFFLSLCLWYLTALHGHSFTGGLLLSLVASVF